MEECLQILTEKQECPADEILVLQVRMQLIVDKISQAPWHDGDYDNPDLRRAPPAFYVKTLQSQLQELKGTIPSRLWQNSKLPSQQHFHFQG